VFCPKCGAEASDDSQFCQKCGRGLNSFATTGTGAAVAPARIAKAEPTKRPFLHVPYTIVGLLILILLVLVYGYNANRTNQAANPLDRLTKQQRVATVKNPDLHVNALSYYSFKLDIPQGASGALLQGNFTASGGAGNDVEVYVLPQDDFVNWQNRHSATALYNSGRVTVGNLNVAFPAAGTYYLVFSNRFGLLMQKTVNVDATLTYYQ
jgi:hypothetical protein